MQQSFSELTWSLVGPLFPLTLQASSVVSGPIDSSRPHPSGTMEGRFILSISMNRVLDMEGTQSKQLVLLLGRFALPNTSYSCWF